MIATTPQKIQLSSGDWITLNDQQTEALQLMGEWIKSRTQLFFTLSGFAGTGKTTITKKLIQDFHKEYEYSNVAVSAPTHKAKKEIRRATGENAYTIQKLLGLRPDVDIEDFDVNKPVFAEKNEKAIKYLRLLVIDEGSMLNSSLFDLIINEASKSRTKVLFMGDEAQLPPVKESISKIFTHVPNRYQLTKVERQAGSNPLMGVYDLIRSNLKTGTDLFSHASATNEAGEGITFHDTRSAFEADVMPLFCSPEYKADPDFIKLITYMNDSVAAWNNLIRNRVHNNPTEPIIPGDVMFAYNTCSINQDEPLIENSQDYLVKEVSEGVSSEGVDIYRVELRSVDEDKRVDVQIVRRSGVPKFLEVFYAKLAAPKAAFGYKKKFLWKMYFEFKATHILQWDLRDQWDELVCKKDIDYGYAITTHKSQGSTYTNVAISENNLDKNFNNEERNKLKYVAFSRPRKRAIVFSNKKG